MSFAKFWNAKDGFETDDLHYGANYINEIYKVQGEGTQYEHTWNQMTIEEWIGTLKAAYDGGGGGGGAGVLLLLVVVVVLLLTPPFCCSRVVDW